MKRKQFEVNVFGLLAVTQAFAPLLGTDLSRQGKPGRIINISSVSGKIGAPFVGAYVASKHALAGMSETLRRELMLFGIDVIVVGPGSIRTPIWGKADFAGYSNTPYKAALVPKPIRNWLLPRLLPTRWIDQVIARRLGLKLRLVAAARMQSDTI